ncbi:hypothetical protein MJM45_32320, partial [Salmonella enterica subsp. enterica serovar Kentucky]|nr:hypothetical protein [Salmonella enterica subsp. enterica serovar Kentucky]
ASVNQELSVSGLVDDTHRTASTTISAYPISTTGKLPAAGDFEVSQLHSQAIKRLRTKLGKL